MLKGSLLLYGTMPGVRIMEKVSDIATSFDKADFIFAQGAEAFQLVSEFFTERICPYIVIESMSCGVR